MLKVNQIVKVKKTYFSHPSSMSTIGYYFGIIREVNSSSVTIYFFFDKEEVVIRKKKVLLANIEEMSKKEKKNYLALNSVLISTQVKSKNVKKKVKNGYFQQNGVIYYSSRAGNVFDTRKPPPNRCYNCNRVHWSKECAFVPQQSRKRSRADFTDEDYSDEDSFVSTNEYSDVNDVTSDENDVISVSTNEYSDEDSSVSTNEYSDEDSDENDSTVSTEYSDENDSTTEYSDENESTVSTSVSTENDDPVDTFSDSNSDDSDFYDEKEISKKNFDHKTIMLTFAPKITNEERRFITEEDDNRFLRMRFIVQLHSLGLSMKVVAGDGK